MNLGMPEMLFVFVLALLIFGPKKLPHIGREIGKAMGEFRRASNTFRSQLESEVRQLETTATGEPAQARGRGGKPIAYDVSQWESQPAETLPAAENAASVEAPQSETAPLAAEAPAPPATEVTGANG